MARNRILLPLVVAIAVLVLFSQRALGLKVLAWKQATQPPPGEAVQYQPVDLQVLRSLGATVVADYPIYCLLEVPSASVEWFAQAAAGKGLVVSAEETFDQIRVNGYTFPSQGKPDVPAELTLPDYPGPTSLYLVQSAGPNRPEWEKALRQVGEPIRYFPDNTWLLRTAPARLKELQALPFVQHASLYQPAYKLQADVLTAPGPVPVIVELDAGQDLRSVMAMLESLTARPLGPPPIGPVATVATEVTASEATTLAFLPEVLWIERVLPATPSDERQTFAVSGNTDPTGTQPKNPPPHYQDWLAGKGFCPSANHPPGCIDYGDLAITGNSAVVLYDTGLDTNVCTAEGSDCLGANGVPGNSAHWDLAGREARFYCADSTSPPTNYCLDSQNHYAYSDDCGHGTAVASVIAGDPVAGVQANGGNPFDQQSFYLGSGVAPLARIVTRKLYHSTGQGACGSFSSFLADDYKRWSAAMVDPSGPFGTTRARFANHSWNISNDPTYSTFSRLFDFLVRDGDGLADHCDRPSTIVFSAGNWSPETNSPRVYSPATAKNVITVGATESWRLSDVAPWSASGYPQNGHPEQCQRGDATSIKNISRWSVRGFAGDGQALAFRFKPDLVAPGTRIGAAYSRLLASLPQIPCAPDPNGDPNGRYYDRHVGTSFAAPVVTGAAVLADAWYRSVRGGAIPSPAMIKAMLVAHAADLSVGTDGMPGGEGTLGHRPTRAQGWGRVNLNKVFVANGPGVAYFDEDHGTNPVRRFVPGSATWSTTLTYTAPNPEIVIVMVFTDCPAVAGATVIAVNNLDLAVRNGNYSYYGNTFDTATGYTPRTLLGLGGDVKNTVEMVRIRPGELTGGSFSVEVRPASINGKAVPTLDAGSNQDFALYVYFAQ